MKMTQSTPDQGLAQPIETSHAAEHHEHERERLRESATMALYISLSLLAILVALPSTLNPATTENPALTILLTSLGLMMAHMLAFRISTRLVNHGRFTAADFELLVAQIVGGLSATVVAVVPVFIIGGPNGVNIAEFLLLAFVAVVGYFAARSVPLSRSRALIYMTLVVGFTLVVLWIKNLVHH